MEENELRLDGNAVGGLLGEIFTMEVTGAGSRCASCGAVEPVGALAAYVQAPGAVLRCIHCSAVVLRVVRRGDRYWLDLTGASYLELRGEA